MRKKRTNKEMYSLAVRTRNRDGSWGEWKDKGNGEWIGLEQVQKQILMLRKAYTYDLEIAFYKDGKYLDYSGNEIGRPIYYERTRR